MSLISKFECLNSNKTLMKVEASLDGGSTFGVIYDATNDQAIYKLIPNNNSGEEYTDNWIVDYIGLWEDTNQDITFPIEWTLYRNDEPVATGTSYVGPFSCPAYESTNTGVSGNLYANYNGKTYSTGLYLNITNSYIEPRLTVYYGSDSITTTKSNPYNEALKIDDVYSGGHMYSQSFSGTYDYVSNDYSVYGEYWSVSTSIDNFPVLEGCSEGQTLGEVSCNGLSVSIIADCYDY